MSGKRWFQRKRYWIAAGAVSLVVFNLASAGSNGPTESAAFTQVDSVPNAPTSAPVAPEVVQGSQNAATAMPTTVKSERQTVQSIVPATSPVQATPTAATPNDELSNDNYYKNVDGDEIHSPAYSEDGSIPVGASAECRDGTYSFSQHRRGTCSGHGGVAEWL